MDRNMGRQGQMSISPGIMRRSGMMQSGRDMPPQNHSPYQPKPNHVGPNAAGTMMNNSGSNGPPPSSSAVHPMHPLQQNHQQLHTQPSQLQHSQHDELIRYINEAWHSIITDKSENPAVFYNGVSEPRLPGFTPFDLEGWWGQRLVHHLNISSHAHQ